MSLRPLAGVRVLDVSSVVMVPWATQVLADLGADVIAVEAPGGNVARSMTPGPAPGLSGVALNLLRNKRSVVLDAREPDERDALLSVAATCDVFATNLRPGSIARIGLTYEELRARRPDVVYCQANGFPSTSERADDPAYDDVIQAEAGVADLFARAGGRPAYAPMALADKVASLTIAYAVTAALLHRERTGEGCFLEVPMVDAVQAFTLVEHAAAATARPTQGPPGYHRVLVPHRRPQRTLDGWVTVLPYSERNWVDLFRAAGREDLADERLATTESRVVHADDLYGELEGIVATRTTAEWEGTCARLGIPFARVRTLEELLDALPEDDHPLAGRYKVLPQPVRWFGQADVEVRRHASLPGADTADVLCEAGLDPDDVIRLLGPGRQPAPATREGPRS